MKNEQQVMDTEAKDEDPFLKSCFLEMGKGGAGMCIVRVVMLALFALIPYFLGKLALSQMFQQKDAPYKYKVEATLIKKDKKVTDYWYADRKKCKEAGVNYATVKNSDDFQYREYKKHKLSVDYYLTWEFLLDGEKHNFTTSSWLFSFQSPGSKKSFKVFSQDGKEFKTGSFSFSLLWLIVLIVSAAIMLAFAFCILGAFYGIVASPFKNKDASSGK